MGYLINAFFILYYLWIYLHMNEFLLAVWKAFYPSYVSPARPTSTNNIRNNLENETLRDLKEHAFDLTENVTSKYAYNLLPRIIESNFDGPSLENFFKFEVKSMYDVMFNALFLQRHIPFNESAVLQSLIFSKFIYRATLEDNSKYYFCRDLTASSNIIGRFSLYTEAKFNEHYNQEIHNRFIVDITFTDVTNENISRNFHRVR